MKLNLPPEEIARAIFDGAAVAWSERDLDGTLELMSDDVVHTVNVDGKRVPFAASVVGKARMREKLTLMFETFEFGAYVTDHLSIKGNIVRARMKIVYIHKETKRRLVTSFRFVIEMRAGRIARIDEFHDASYLEAFVRLVEWECAD